MNDYSVDDFINMIDENFQRYAGRIGRLDVSWGMWSREMNTEIQKRLSEDDPDAILLGLVFSYWIVVSQLLDLIYNYKGLRRFLLGKKIKNKAAEIVDIRERIYASS